MQLWLDRPNEHGGMYTNAVITYDERRKVAMEFDISYNCVKVYTDISIPVGYTQLNFIKVR